MTQQHRKPLPCEVVDPERRPLVRVCVGGGDGLGRGINGARASADPPSLWPFVFLSLQAPWLRSGPGRCEALAARARLVGVSPARGPGPRGARSGQCRAERGSGNGGPGSHERVEGTWS